MLFAKNSDRNPDEAQVLEWHPRRERRRPPAHAVPHGSTTRRARASSDRGPPGCGAPSTASTSTASRSATRRSGPSTTRRPAHPRSSGMDLVRLGLERGRTADDALAVMTHAIAEHGQGGSGEHGYDAPYFSSFLIADTRGGWVLETSARTWAARPVGDGASISNRLTLTTDWTSASADVAPGTDFDRYRLVSYADLDRRSPARIATSAPCCRRNAAATVADVAATLRDHGNGRWGAAISRRPARAKSATIGAGTPCACTGASRSRKRPRRSSPSSASGAPAARPGRASATRASASTSPLSLGRPAGATAGPGAVEALRPAARPGRGRPRRARPRRRPVLRPVEAELWADADATPPRADAGPRPGPQRRMRPSTRRCIDSASESPTTVDCRAAIRPAARDAGVGVFLTVEFNLADLWERVADTVPDHEALVCADRRLTFAEVDARATRLAHVLGRRRASVPATMSPATCTTRSSTSKACWPRSSCARCRSTSTTATSKTSCDTCSTTPT